RRAQVAEVRVVIDSEHGHFMRHTEPRAAARIENVMPAVIVRRENSHWFSQLFQPLGNLLLLLFPRPLPAPTTIPGEHFTLLSVLPHKLDEVITAKILRRIFPARPAAEGETFQAALLQVVVADA